MNDKEFLEELEKTDTYVITALSFYSPKGFGFITVTPEQFLDALSVAKVYRLLTDDGSILYYAIFPEEHLVMRTRVEGKEKQQASKPRKSRKSSKRRGREK